MSSVGDVTSEEQLEPYELLTSTRYDPFLRSLRWNYDRDGPSALFLLPQHFGRLQDAIDRHGWYIPSFTYDELKSRCKAVVAEAAEGDADPSAAMKLRITLSSSGVLSVTTSPVAPFQRDPTLAAYFQPTDDPALLEPSYRLEIDSQPTRSSIFTRTKTTQRSLYDAARQRAGIFPGDLKEVLLYNENGEMTEASISNVAFFRESYWVTPPSSTGCLPGVLRAWLLEQGRIREAAFRIKKDDVRAGEWVMLTNGVHGCRFGKVVGA
ncbi:aminotransferase [Schizophyllum commune]